MRNVRSQKGFTLLELMIVVAIIAILAAIAVPSFSSSSDAAKIAKIRADLRTLDSAHMIYIANGNTALAAASNATAITAALVPAYITAMPTPPSGYAGAYVIGANTRAAYMKTAGAYQYADAASYTP